MAAMERLSSATLYVLTSLVMTSLTKYAASVWGFPGSSLLLLVECLATVLALAATQGRYRPFSRDVLRHLPLVTVSKAANMYLSFIAMRRTSLPVYNVLKRLQPIYALVQDWLIRGTTATSEELIGVLFICAGTIVTGLGDFDFDVIGYAVAIVAAGTQSLYLVLSRQAQDAVGSLTHVDLLFYTAFFNLAIFGPLSLGEWPEASAFLAQEGELLRLGKFLVPYVLLGAALNFTTFWCTAVNSPLATAVAGSLKGITSTAAGLLFFNSRLSPLGWLGMLLSTAGGLVYSLAQVRKKAEAKKDK